MVFSNIPWVPRHTLAAAALSLGLLCSTQFQTPPTVTSVTSPPTVRQATTANSYQGVGLAVTPNPGQLTVVRPLEGSPAQLAGLQPGDVIEKIDGSDCSRMSTDQAISRLRGQAGSVVVLQVFRPSTGDNWELELERATVEIPEDLR